MTNEEKIAPIKRILEEVWNQKRLELLPELCRSDIRMYSSDGYTEGYEQVRDEYISPVISAFPDIHHVVEEFIVDGDRVAMRYRGSGTHQKLFDGKKPTGKRLDYEGVTIFHQKENKVHEVCNYSNWSDKFAAL